MSPGGKGIDTSKSIGLLPGMLLFLFLEKENGMR
jgi:hypothetical protein